MRALLVAMCVFSADALADSPLTSIDFHKAYADEPAVKAALERNLERSYSFLAGGASNDRKLAVANALGWQQDSAMGFLEFLAQGKDVKPDALTVGQLTPSQLFAFAYLVSLSHYLELEALEPKGKNLLGMKPIALMQAAASASPNDFAVQYANALVKAQRALASEWCKVFTLPHDVETAFPPEKRNLRQAALDEANDYLAMYEDECPGSKAAAKKSIAELNQIYTLSIVGNPAQLVAGTQGGIVIWDPKKNDKPIATRPGFICSGDVIGGVAWIGCEKEVVRWDGAKFVSYLPRTKNSTGEYYQPMAGPGGEVWVRLGAKVWQFDEKKNAFAPVASPPWGFDPYDAIFFEGQPYSIEFLKAIHVGPARIDRSSELYAGKDPRHFRIDENGTLWVEDFESGLFRLEKGRFVAQPGLKAKASGTAYDVSRKTRYLLHYTDGLIIQREGEADQFLDLKDLENMRDFTLDPATGDVWVGGWGQLVRLRPDGKTFGKQRFRVR
ncbi:MAG: hypothetical protein QM817_41475 [Archangium sp.]